MFGSWVVLEFGSGPDWNYYLDAGGPTAARTPELLQVPDADNNRDDK